VRGACDETHVPTATCSCLLHLLTTGYVHIASTPALIDRTGIEG
jgi:hypothetical protein